MFVLLHASDRSFSVFRFAKVSERARAARNVRPALRAKKLRSVRAVTACNVGPAQRAKRQGAVPLAVRGEGRRDLATHWFYVGKTQNARLIGFSCGAAPAAPAGFVFYNIEVVFYTYVLFS